MRSSLVGSIGSGICCMQMRFVRLTPLLKDGKLGDHHRAVECARRKDLIEHFGERLLAVVPGSCSSFTRRSRMGESDVEQPVRSGDRWETGRRKEKKVKI